MKRFITVCGVCVLASLLLLQCKPRPEGRIAFVSAQAGERAIHVIDLEGALLDQLAYNEFRTTNLAWSPDGARIAFDSHAKEGWQIFVMDTDGGNLVQVTEEGGWRPTWSPDGEHLAFVGNDGDFEIYTIDVDGSHLSQLTHNTTDDDRPVWSPDGSQIAFVCCPDGPPQICRMEIDGSNVARLTNGSWSNLDPAWSPDGEHIAFASNRWASEESVRSAAGRHLALHIYIMGVDGEDVVQVTDSPFFGFRPAWSPSGQQIAFECQDSNICTVASDGSNPLLLTNGEGGYYSPVWLP